MKKNIRFAIISICIIGATYLLANRTFFRIDLTSEKKYSLSANTKNLMRRIENPIQVLIYLEGDLNAGFLQLRNALKELLDEFSIYANDHLQYKFVEPSQASTQTEREQYYDILARRGLQPTTVYDRNADGKTIQKTIFPWIEIIQNNDTFAVHLLKNIPGYSGAENINISIENLEFEITDALRTLNTKDTEKIAFIEGHDELSENETYDISTLFSRYFQIDRGQIGINPDELSPYKAIIIAKPQKPYTETEKYIIDQYIMNGGHVLWLIDGIKTDHKLLTEQGSSPCIATQTNLDDMLFRYGIRIAPVVVQDVQCVQIPINVSQTATPQYEPIAWHYAPLLLPSQVHPATRNLMQVKADFCSIIESVGDDQDIEKNLLLVTSNATHLTTAPSIIDLNKLPDSNSSSYFNMQYLPVAVTLQGHFTSIYQNRMPPEQISIKHIQKNKSEYTRMAIVADGDLIRNDIIASGKGYQILPAGYDRYSGIQFGNRDFLLNTLLYITDDEGWMALRNRTFKIRMLNKSNISNHRTMLQLINLTLPILCLLLFAGIHFTYRRFKYRHKNCIY